jgi:sugar O-acyltransferase (sialic acid O-acetyltransferase NeuD family)
MDLIIVGAGGLGREVYSWLSQEIKEKQSCKIKGFIDDNLNSLNDFEYPVKIINTISEYRPNAKEKLVLSILNPKNKKRIVESLSQRGAKFYKLIHPTSIIGTNVELGKGCVICPNCILTNDIQIGDFVFINTNSTIGYDTVIGDFTTINGKVEITGKVKVGSGCSFGVGAKVIPGRTIGDNVVVGAGSIVIRNFGSDVTIFGNPAKKVKG